MTRTTLCLATLILSISLCGISWAQESIEIGSFLRIVTVDTEVVEGELVDKTPNGYLVRKPDGRVQHVEYDGILAMKELGPEDVERLRAPPIREPEPEPRYTSSESEIVVEPETRWDDETEDDRRAEDREPDRDRDDRRETDDRRSEPDPPREERAARASDDEATASTNGMLPSPVLFAAGFEYSFYGHTSAGTTLRIVGLLGASVNIGIKIMPANLVPELGISIAGNRGEGEWLGIPGEELWDTDDIDYNSPGRITASVLRVSLVPGLRYVLGMRKHWIFQPYVGAGVQLSFTHFDYGGDTSLSFDVSDGDAYFGAQFYDRDDFEVAGALTAGFKIWHFYFEGEFRIGDNQKVSVGFQI